jgi:hypothetical protein
MSEYKVEPRHWFDDARALEARPKNKKVLSSIGLTMLKGLQVVRQKVAPLAPESSTVHLTTNRPHVKRMTRAFIPVIGQPTASLIPREEFEEPDSNIMDEMVVPNTQQEPIETIHRNVA